MAIHAPDRTATLIAVHDTFPNMRAIAWRTDRSTSSRRAATTSAASVTSPPTHTAPATRCVQRMNATVLLARFFARINPPWIPGRAARLCHPVRICNEGVAS